MSNAVRRASWGVLFLALAGCVSEGPVDIGASISGAGAALKTPDFINAGSNYMYTSIGALASLPPTTTDARFNEVWYRRGELDQVTDVIDTQLAQVKAQLKAMRANGQQRIVTMVGVINRQSLPAHQRDRDAYGHLLVLGNDRRLLPRHKTNFAKLVREIDLAGFSQFVVRFGYWDAIGNYRAVAGDYKALIDDVHRIVDANRGGLDALYDLGAELAGVDNEKRNTRLAVRDLWRWYRSNWGTADTLGFSVATGGKESVVSRRLERLFQDYAGHYPSYAAVDVYTNLSVTLKAARKTLKQLGRNVPLIVLETNYWDAGTRDQIRALRRSLNIQTVFQWPWQHWRPLPHLAVHTTPNYSYKSSPLLQGGAIACPANDCVWIIGYNYTRQAKIRMMDGTRHLGAPKEPVWTLRSDGRQAVKWRVVNPQIKQVMAMKRRLSVALSEPGLGQSNTVTVCAAPGCAPPTRPEVTAAGLGCADRYCVWLQGKHFAPHMTVQARRKGSWDIIGRWSSDQLKFRHAGGKKVITLAVDPGSLRQQLNSPGLCFWVVDPANNTWSPKPGCVQR
jgi:hypothetical protein